MQWAKEVYNEYKDAAFDVIQTALTIANFISPPGLSAVFGLINLGIDYARGKPVTWQDVGLAALPGVGALGRVAGVGSRLLGASCKTASRAERTVQSLGQFANAANDVYHVFDDNSYSLYRQLEFPSECFQVLQVIRFRGSRTSMSLGRFKSVAGCIQPTTP